MVHKQLQRLGAGTYSAADAARLVGVSAERVRRWLRGYEISSPSGVHRSAPLWRGEFAADGEFLELGFRDLMELRAISAFLELEVPWSVVRRAHERAAKLVGHQFPFSTSTFSTDGARVFAEAAAQGNLRAPPADVISGQAVFDKLTARHLVDMRKIAARLVCGVEFGADELPRRWAPLGTRRQVVLDPSRGYGQPIVKREGVPTRVLAAAVEAGDRPATVARWFEVSMPSLRDALDWERRRVA